MPTADEVQRRFGKGSRKLQRVVLNGFLERVLKGGWKGVVKSVFERSLGRSFSTRVLKGSFEGGFCKGRLKRFRGVVKGS